ncbi:MAG: trimeric intracellular cation channel family protein [Cyanobacteria bacterium Co-bin13]|nr:trimeric intracellular cation channel family protein [Cyanobacteria bacterium Co-bin13]
MEPAAILNQIARLTALQTLIEPVAVMVFAFSGMVPARTKQMDGVGVYIVAFVTALGGGTLRDVLLDQRPLFWVEHQEYPILILILVLIFLYAPRFNLPFQPLARQYFNLVDALGLGLFSISGTAAALAHQIPLFPATLFGVITGVFGGVLRDVLITEIPMIFRQSTSLYATCSFVGCWAFLLALWLEWPDAIAVLLGITTTTTLRLLALHFNLTLPLGQKGG